MLRRRMVVVVVLVLVLAVTVGIVDGPSAAGAAPAPAAAPSPPVDGVVVDHFRPPPTRFAAGNRGLDYRVAPLTPVRAALDGEVLFAGQVGGALHVTIRHRDGLRTSYSFLATLEVRAGQAVRQGDVVGLTGDVLHFGLRDPDGEYLDPEAWLAGSPAWQVRLVPSGDDGGEPAPGDAAGRDSPALLDVVGERWRALDSLVAGGGSEARYAASALAQRLRFWAHDAIESRAETHVRRVAAGVAEWFASRDRCTPPTQDATPVAGRRIVIEVGGLGSTSQHAAIDDLRTTDLGYAPPDVIRFSYNGGAIPDRAGSTGAGTGAPAWSVTSYNARDSQQDLFEAGRRLRDLIDVVVATHPGVPVDVVAHSQGGIVARLAIEERRAVGLPPVVAHLVTLGTPHQGADLASLVEALGRTPAGDEAIIGTQRALGLDLDARLPAAHQLVATSPVVDVLRAHPPPPGVAVTSIAARGDLVVPAGRTDVGGDRARRTTVSLTGIHAHDELPGSAAATREVALALTDRPPTCRGLGTALVDAGTAELIAWSEAVLAHAAPGT